MRLIRSVRALPAWRRRLDREGVVIGLVPTMGALHAGHRALIRAARLSCDAVVVSLFVNPRQFGPSEDFARYPRRLRGDASLCRAEGVDVLFAPSREEIYPAGFGTVVTVPAVSRRWEGECRPGHFEGVATVVTKLMAMVRPHLAFFGQKDYQQAAVIRRLVADLDLGIDVRVCPTARDADGVALSSRNHYLTSAQRRAAPVLYAALRAGQAALLAGARSAVRIRRAMQRVVSSEPRALLEYLAVCDPETLEPLRRVTDKTVLLGAIRIGRVRLIDNVVVGCRGRQ
ncbi:MAG: pantoate--beta-alanine ligase [Nitrospiraceae bacterium]